MIKTNDERREFIRTNALSTVVGMCASALQIV
jgi:hypothetical protein